MVFIKTISLSEKRPNSSGVIKSALYLIAFPEYILITFFNVLIPLTEAYNDIKQEFKYIEPIVNEKKCC